MPAVYRRIANDCPSGIHRYDDTRSAATYPNTTEPVPGFSRRGLAIRADARNRLAGCDLYTHTFVADRTCVVKPLPRHLRRPRRNRPRPKMVWFRHRKVQTGRTYAHSSRPLLSEATTANRPFQRGCVLSDGHPRLQSCVVDPLQSVRRQPARGVRFVLFGSNVPGAPTAASPGGEPQTHIMERPNSPPVVPAHHRLWPPCPCDPSPHAATGRAPPSTTYAAGRTPKGTNANIYLTSPKFFSTRFLCKSTKEYRSGMASQPLTTRAFDAGICYSLPWRHFSYVHY